MPVKTPFYEKMAPLCISHRWKEWAGYLAVNSFSTSHELEYNALRHAAGLIDVSPLFKYDVSGPEAAQFLSYLTVKDIHYLQIGQVTYLVWCDDDGKIIDDGTVTRLGESLFRVTSAEPSYSWFTRRAKKFQVIMTDVSEEICALSLQGPTSRDILKNHLGPPIERLKFFRMLEGKIGRVPVMITRTGYTGDLGYEIWASRQDAESLWDELISSGRGHGLEPAGLDAMDICRIEAGFILNGVDYFSAHHCLTEDRKSSPFELGLGWTIQLDREPFVGQEALRREKKVGSSWNWVGLEIDWDSLEQLYTQRGLPPGLSSQAWRGGIPVYHPNRQQVGYATSGTWSPILKKNLALAHIQYPHHRLGSRLEFEITVEYERLTVPATVVKPPFFNPNRKRATPL